MLSGLDARTEVDMDNKGIFYLICLVVLTGCSCDREVEEEIQEKCELYIDFDGDGSEGCLDSDCVEHPSCTFPYRYIQESVFAWYKLPKNEHVSIMDTLKGGYVQNVTQNSRQIHILATCVPRYQETGLVYCGNTAGNNEYGYTRLWRIQEDEVEFGEHQLDWENGIVVAEGGWEQDIGMAYNSAMSPYASLIIDDLDMDNNDDFLISQPSTSMGAGLMIWYGESSVPDLEREPDIAMVGTSFNRMAYLGYDQNEESNSYGYLDSENGNTSMRVFFQGDRYSQEEFNTVTTNNTIAFEMDMAHLEEVFFAGETAIGKTNEDGELAFLAAFSSYNLDEGEILQNGTNGTILNIMDSGSDADNIYSVGREGRWHATTNFTDYGDEDGPTHYPYAIADVNCDGKNDYIVGKPKIRQEDTLIDSNTTEIPQGGVIVVNGNNNGWAESLVAGENDLVMMFPATLANDKVIGRQLVVNDFNDDGCDDVLVWDFDSFVPYSINKEIGGNAIVGVGIYAGRNDIFEAENGFIRPDAILVVPETLSDLPDEYQQIEFDFSGTFSRNNAYKTIDADGLGKRDILISRYALNEVVDNTDYTPGTIAYIISSEVISELLADGS